MASENKFAETAQSSRYDIDERFKNPVALNGSYAAGKNEFWEFSGFSCAAGQSFLASGGGQGLATFSGVTGNFSGFSGAIAYIQAQQAAGQSAAKSTNWSTSKSPRFECILTTSSDIGSNGSQIIYAGLKLTNTPTIATDDDQVYFYYDAGVTSPNWQIVNSRANVDVQTRTNIAVAASTTYRLVIDVQADRTVKCSINDQPATVSPLPALTASVNLNPYVGMKDMGGTNPVTCTVNY